MKQYLDLLNHIMETGVDKSDRTGTGTRSVFGYQMRLNLQEGFPLLTTKKLYIKAIVGELIWFMRGDTNIKYLNDNKINIWNEWADENGDLGPVYGKQWRDSQGIDQLMEVVESLKKNPDSRRHIVSSWLPKEIPDMALPPCHCLYQFYVANNKLSCQLYQRSSDCFLGVPFNIASYALLTHIIADHCGFEVGDFIWTSGDTHIYSNHFDQVREQLSRTPTELPKLKFTHRDNLEDYEISDFEIVDYVAQPTIKGDIAI